MKIKTNGIELNCVIEGDGPWVTMSHSLACNLSMWDEQAKLLVANGYKVLRFDTRGHGASDAPEGAYTLEQMADDLHGLYVALGIRQSHWVGLSMGGYGAWFLGGMLSRNVAAVAPICGFISDPRNRNKSVGFTEEGERRAEAAFAQLFGKAGEGKQG